MAKAKNKVESVKLEFGSVRQKTPGGTYYFRYQLNGIRKEIPLHTYIVSCGLNIKYELFCTVVRMFCENFRFIKNERCETSVGTRGLVIFYKTITHLSKNWLLQLP